MAGPPSPLKAEILFPHRRNDAARVHLADHTVSGIGDIHVALAIEGDSIGLVQRSAGGFAAVSGIDFGRAGAGHVVMIPLEETLRIRSLSLSTI